MCVLVGEEIAERRILSPYAMRTEMVAAGIKTTFGQSYCGYDLRLNKVNGLEEIDDGVWYMLPRSFALASTLERFHMPNDLVGIVHDKSSWARRGLAVQNTVIEPGWEGYLTLELTNHGDEALKLVRGMGICQVMFHTLTCPVNHGYDGKYQGQGPEPTPAK